MSFPAYQIKNKYYFRTILYKKLLLSLSMSWRHIGGEEVQLHSFLTLASEGDKHLTAITGSFTLVAKHPVPTEQEAGWIPEQVWMILSTDKSPVPERNGTRIIQPVS